MSVFLTNFHLCSSSMAEKMLASEALLLTFLLKINEQNYYTWPPKAVLKEWNWDAPNRQL